MLWHSLVLSPPSSTVPAWTSSGVDISIIEPGAAAFKTVLIFNSVTAFFFFCPSSLVQNSPCQTRSLQSREAVGSNVPELCRCFSSISVRFLVHKAQTVGPPCQAVLLLFTY